MREKGKGSIFPPLEGISSALTGNHLRRAESKKDDQKGGKNDNSRRRNQKTKKQRREKKKRGGRGERMAGGGFSARGRLGANFLISIFLRKEREGTGLREGLREQGKERSGRM